MTGYEAVGIFNKEPPLPDLTILARAFPYNNRDVEFSLPSRGSRGILPGMQPADSILIWRHVLYPCPFLQYYIVHTSISKCTEALLGELQTISDLIFTTTLPAILLAAAGAVKLTEDVDEGRGG